MEGYEPIEVIRPELAWEDAELPLVESIRAISYEPVHELRDPFAFLDENKYYLLSFGAGEQSIGIVQFYRM